MAPVGAFALLDCKPRQGRKAATVVIDASAEGVLTGATLFKLWINCYHVLISGPRKIAELSEFLQQVELPRLISDHSADRTGNTSEERSSSIFKTS
jgi:hypothetical protein